MDLDDLTTTIKSILDEKSPFIDEKSPFIDEKSPFIDDETTERLTAILAEYSVMNRGDWSKYAFFNDEHYVRNFVSGNDRYELIVICWGRGQKSRIHDHERSECIFTVLSGRVEEFVYDLDLVLETKNIYEKGHVSYIQYDELHTVGNHEESNEADGAMTPESGAMTPESGAMTPESGAVTLHLYFPPIKKVKLFDPVSKETTERIPGFYSINGLRVQT